MKVLVLHPPLYPVNYDFYNHLGSKVELMVLQFGEYPTDHKNWTAKSLYGKRKNFSLIIIGNGSDSIINQLHLNFLLNIYKFKPDIVLSIAFWIPSLIISLLKRHLKCKFIILTNAIIATEESNSFIRKKIRKFITYKTDCFISASELTSSFLQSLYKEIKIELSKQTIDILSWRNEFDSLPNKTELRKSLNLPEDLTILLGVGNFSYKKNWMSIISLMKDIDNSLLLLIGDGIEKEKYLTYIKNNNLNGKVLINSKIEGKLLISYFKLADMFVLPSLYEQYGFVIPEALCSDLPVLCSKNVGASCLIKDGINGFIIDPNTDYGSKIKELIREINTIKNNCYSSVKEMTLENRANEFHTIFKNIISNKI